MDNKRISFGKVEVDLREISRLNSFNEFATFVGWDFMGLLLDGPDQDPKVPNRIFHWRSRAEGEDSA
jgi:hypothetical protein